MKKLITILFLLIALPAYGASTLWEYYSLQGLNLPSIDERAVIYQNISNDAYRGFYGQNVALLDYLENDSYGYAPTTGYVDALSVFITSTATTIPVESVLDKDGITLPCSTTNKCYFNIEIGTSKEEGVVCTGISGSNLTGCTRGLVASGESETASTTLAFSHNGGAEIILTNLAQFYSNFMDVWNDQTATGTKTFINNPIVPAPTSASHATTKAYVDSIAQQGGATSTESVVGIVQLGTQIEMASSTHDSDSPAVLYTKYATSSPDVRGLYIPVAENDGYLNQGWLDLTEDFAFSTTTQATSTITRANITNLQVGSTTITEYPTASSSIASKGYVDNNAGCSSSATSTDFIWVSEHTEVTKNSASYVKAKEYRIWCVGEITPVFEISNDGGADSTTGRIYVNDIAIGAEFVSPADTSYASSTPENISVNRGDKVSVYIKETVGGVGNAKIRDFTIYANRAGEPLLLLP